MTLTAARTTITALRIPVAATASASAGTKRSIGWTAPTLRWPTLTCSGGRTACPMYSSTWTHWLDDRSASTLHDIRNVDLGCSALEVHLESDRQKQRLEKLRA